MAIKKVNILGVNLDSITMEEALSLVEQDSGAGPRAVFTPNPEIIMRAQKDNKYKDILNSADLSLADGIGVVIASKILKTPLPQRITGFDFVNALFGSDKSFYLFGAKPGVAATAADKLRARGVNIVGTHHGFFDAEEEINIISDINQQCPDVLLVCLGAPKQEKWIAANRHKINAGLCLGLGSTLDIIAGNVPRAPVLIQRLGMEWLYRAIIQPSRIPRLIAIPEFLYAVLHKYFQLKIGR